MNMITKTEEYVAFDENEAYNFLEEKRKEIEVLNSSVKHKKDTKKTVECWIVTVKLRVQDLKELIGNGE